MQHRGAILWVVVLLAAGHTAAAAESAARKLYKWTDAQGVTHYGDHIPPEYAADETHIINTHGVETAHIDAQRSPEQMAAEEQKRTAAEASAARDHNLLNTYVTVAEIERLRDQRLALLLDQVKVTGQFLDVLNGRLGKLSGAGRRFHPYSADPKAPPMSDQFAEDLVRVTTDIHTQEQNLREKRSEEATMRQQFESDIARFRELKGLH